jgi:transposase
LGLGIRGAIFNADKAFYTKVSRKTCFNHGLIRNMDFNKRNRKVTKRGRKLLFDEKVYKHRFTSERYIAWIDKFRALLLKFDHKDAYFFGAHCIAFEMINLRHVFDH